VTERQMKQALCRQFGATFVDLDTASIDRTLTHLVSKAYAQHHRVIPVARTGNRLLVAQDDPADVEVIDELATVTGCRIEVVTSTYAAFQRAFLRAYLETGTAARAEVPPGAVTPPPFAATPAPAAPPP